MAVRDLTLPSLGPRLAEFARRSGLAGMWTWWMAQLNALVPSKPRAALERRRMRPVLVFDGDRATLWRPAMDGERAVMRATTTIALAGDAATVAAGGRAAIATLAGGNFGVDAVAPKVVLSLPPREVLRKTVVLPAAVEPSLRQTLAYDLDRHTPFKAEELYFDAVVVGRIPEKKEIRVDLVSCRKAVVDVALRHAAAWGATVLAAVPELPATAATSRLNLLPHESRASHVVWKRWQFWLPLALVAAVALAAIAIPLWQKRDFAITLNTLANEARARAAVSDALRAELETKAGDYNFALEKKYAYPSAFRVIDEVSRVLPDDTWLTQMEMKTIAKGKENQRELLVRGESANAGRLVQLVEESTLFAQTAPRSPTTKIQPGPGEIFDLGAQVKPLAAPAQVALLGAEKSPDAAGNAPAATASPPTAPVLPAVAPAPIATEKGGDAPATSASPSPSPSPPAAAPLAGSTLAPAPAPAVPAAVAPAKPAAMVPTATAPPAAASKAQGPPPAGVPDPWISAPRPKAARVPPPVATPSAPPASMQQPNPPATGTPARAPSGSAGNGAKP
jgi:general secretion pathway protein L